MTRFLHILLVLAFMPSAFADVLDHATEDALAAEAALLAPAFTPTEQQLLAPTPDQFQTTGSWSPVIAWTPHVPVTLAQLPDGRLLTFASSQKRTFPVGNFTYAATWDYRTGAFVEINNTSHDMFCGGVSLLPDGRLLVCGGNGTIRNTSMFDWRTNQWIKQPSLKDPRWYNTSVALPDGSVFTASGSGGSDTAERWLESIGWTRLSNINWALAHGEGGMESIWHPFLHVAPDGRIAHTGPTKTMHWVDTAGTGQFISTSTLQPGSHYPKDGALVMFDVGKILQAGGRTHNGGASRLANVVDINGPVPSITPTGSLNHARTFANGVVLPTGEVMAMGGNTSQIKFSDEGSVLTPEIWNPVTGQWREAANMTVPRNYHSLAVLLPDGRVWSGGGGLGGNDADHPDAQIYTPGVLFNADGTPATRPVITEAPEVIGPGMSFNLRATGGMQKFAFIRLNSLTHSVCSDLRLINLPFVEESAGAYAVQTIANLNVMTPGYWMLFAVAPDGVYSESRIILVSPESAPVFASPGDQFSPVDRNVELQIHAAGAGTLTYSAVGLPAGLQIHASTGLISGVPSVTGESDVTVTVISSTGLAASHRFHWTISQVNGAGSLLREWWVNISGRLVSDLTGNAAYPDHPSGSDLLTSFETPTDWADNMGQRVRGWIHPPITGDYRFWVAGDDETQLKLSTDHTPEKAVIIAHVPDWATPRQWSWYPEQTSALIRLEAGKRYYIEALMKEATGGDNLATAWEVPGSGSGPVIIAGTFLSPWTPDPGRPPVVTNPGTQHGLSGTAVSLPIIASDPDEDSLTFSASGLPDGLVIHRSSGVISGTLAAAGTFDSIVSVADGINPPVTTSFTWNVAPALGLQPLTGAPVLAGSTITFNAVAQGGLNPLFSWNFGDGSPATAFTSSTTIAKEYSNPGRYLVTLTARDDRGTEVAVSFRQAVHAVLTPSMPVVSSSLVYQSRTGANARLWVVNPDQDSVTVFDAITRARTGIIATGRAPRSVAIAPDGRAWVVNSSDSTITVIGTNLVVAQTVPLPRGSRPFAVLFDPAGANAYVSLQDTGTVLKINPALPTQVTGSAFVGADVRHLSVSADGSTVLATRFITPKLPGEDTATVITEQGGTKHGGIVVALNAATMTVTRSIILEHSNETDSSLAGRGIPNYLGPAVISPDGLSAWVPSKKDNIKRGLLRDGQPLTHDSAVRSIASRIDLTTQTEDASARIDFNDAGIPSTAVFERTGTYLFTALEGSREIAVIDSWERRELLRFTAGRAPQGVATSPDGRTLYVHNFMDRTITVHDVTALIDGVESAPALVATLNCTTTEKLAADVFKGKQLFYDSRDQRLALQQYVSCAACHNDGDNDGRVWDFTGFGEGLRNNISLKGHAGHGPSHWSGNFDEIQDFEGQIRSFAGGLGLMTDNAFHSGTRDQPLGDPKVGVSADLDALAAYVNSLTSVGSSPHRNANGTLTADAVAGQQLFRANNCAACHSGSRFTNSALNVFASIGTIKPASGKRLGAELNGLDVPTLRGLWQTAPYLHDGSAATIAEAVQAHQGLTLNDTEVNQLTAFLKQIDDQPASPPAPLSILLEVESTTVNAPFPVTGTLSEAASGFDVSDITIAGGSISGFTLSGTSFTFRVTPTADSVQISIAADVMTDATGLGNLASNVLQITNSSDVEPPAITLATSSANVSGPFSVIISASEPVQGLTELDFSVTNGVAGALTGSGTVYSVAIQPAAAGPVTVQLPAGTVTDLANNASSSASNLITVIYTPAAQVTSIKLQAEDFDEGGEGVSWHDTTPDNIGQLNSGLVYRTTSVDIEPSEDADGTPSIAWTDAGEWLQYTTALSAGTYEFNIRAATMRTGPLQVRLSVNGAEVATANVTSTGGWNTWRTFSVPNVNIPVTGETELRLEFLTPDINLNWFELINTTVIPDTQKPDVTLATAGSDVSGPFLINATFSEPVTGVGLSDFIVTNGSASNFSGTDAGYSVLVTPGMDGPVTISLPAGAAFDAAGNSSNASALLSVNYTAPLDPRPTVVLTAAGSVTEVFTVSAQFSEAVSGVTDADFIVTNGSVTGLSGGEGLWIATIQPTTAGTVSIRLAEGAAQDAAGQDSFASNVLNVLYAPPGAFATKINFQSAGAPVPAEYISDIGETFSGRNGLNFGWNVDHSAYGRDRNTVSDQRQDTHIRLRSGARWELELPNGEYDVSVSVGDATAASTNTIRIEGIQLWNALACAATEFHSQLVRVQVSDGRLTLDNGSAADLATALNYIHVASSSGPLPERQNGLTADYFAGINFDQLRFSRIDSTIDFRWSNTSPDVRLAADNFSVRWHGCIIPKFTERYTFTTMSDDGVRLWVNGVLLVDNWTNHGETWDTGELDLEAGVPVLIKMEFYENGGDAVARLAWASGSQPFELVPASQLLLNENGMNAAPYPETFAAWTDSGRSNGSGSLTTAFTNADGDDLPDLLEYALGGSAGSGINAGEGLHLSEQNGVITAGISHPASITDLRWFLESTPDLKNWSALPIAPVALDNQDGTETLRWTLPTSPAGIIRLRVQSFRNGDTATSAPMAWQTFAISQGTQTVGVNVVNAPVFAGYVHSSSPHAAYVADASWLPGAVDPDASYYLEVRSGPHAGHRFNLALIGDRVLVIDTESPNNSLTALPSDLAGSRIAIHKHVTLGQVFDKTRLHGTTNRITADQVLFITKTGYQGYWLLKSGNRLQWSAASDASAAVADNTIIPPGTAVFLKTEAARPPSLIVTGQVRTTPFARPLAPGYQMITTPWPLDGTPESLGMTDASVFLATQNPLTSDAIQLWKGDSTAGTQGYQGYWLFQRPNAPAQWTSSGDASLQSQNATLLLKAGRGQFLNIRNPKPAQVWISPPP